MKKATYILLSILAGLIIGLGYAVKDIREWKNDNNALSVGPWRTLARDKDVDEDLLNIAQIAVYGTYPLKKSEVIYFTANKDSEGNELNTDFEYVVEGKKFDARYWSIVAYDENGFLIDNPENINAYNLETVTYEQDSTTNKLYLTKTKSEKNYLPVGNAKKIILAIRLYHPSVQLRENLGSTAFPTIKKL